VSTLLRGCGSSLLVVVVVVVDSGDCESDSLLGANRHLIAEAEGVSSGLFSQEGISVGALPLSLMEDEAIGCSDPKINVKASSNAHLEGDPHPVTDRKVLVKASLLIGGQLNHKSLRQGSKQQHATEHNT